MTNSVEYQTNQKNLLLLIYLRWLAVGGQVATIAFVHFILGFALPLPEMGSVIVFLVGLNIVGLHRYAGPAQIAHTELFVELLLDVAALTCQLYLSGGASNPFISLFLLQVILGAVLLQRWATWVLVLVTSACFVLLTVFNRDIGLSHAHSDGAMRLHLQGMFICFLLAAVLLVLFVTRINGNLREQDARLAAMRQQSAEEEHIVRMGLLASGAAHEISTPLSTLSVILNDWEKLSLTRNEPEIREDLDEMKSQIDRCKEIVSNILLSAGESRGEDTHPASLVAFLDETVAQWRQSRAPVYLEYRNELTVDHLIASDIVLKQALFNVLDNAREASGAWLSVSVCEDGDDVLVMVEDRGPGFPPAILAQFGKPYLSSKAKPGSGLGLFLVVNVLRKLGGRVAIGNRTEGGARVELRLPLAAISLDELSRVG